MHIKPKRIILQFIFTFAVLIIVPTFYFANEYSRLSNQHIKELQQQNQSNINYSFQQLDLTLTAVQNTTRQIARSFYFFNDLQLSTEQKYNQIAELWKVIFNTHPFYSDFIYIDNTGFEKLRLSFNGQKINRVNEIELKDNNNADIFKYAQTLKPDSIGAFGIYLTKNNNQQVLEPIQPNFNLVAPIENNGRRLGYFITNLSLKNIFSQLQPKLTQNLNSRLINQDGYILLSNDDKEIFGHQIDSRTHFNLTKMQPNLWNYMQNQESGSFFDGKQWHTFQKLRHNLTGISQNTYFLISTNNQKLIQSNEYAVARLSEQAILLAILISGIAGVFTLWNILHKNNSLENKITKAAMNSMSALIITNKENKIIKINDEFTKLFNYSLHDVINQTPAILSSKQHSHDFYESMWDYLNTNKVWEGEIINRKKDGTICTLILRIQPILDDDYTIQYYVGSFVDITNRKALEMKLRTLSEKDALTNLWNRRKFDRLLHDEVLLVCRYPEQSSSCLAIFDIDNFKTINDTLGHDRGDLVLKQVASILNNKSRITDSVARIGGEEFAIILPHTDIDKAHIVLDRLREHIANHPQSKATISGGITYISDDVSATYKRADSALYQSKQQGKNQITSYEELMKPI